MIDRRLKENPPVTKVSRDFSKINIGTRKVNDVFLELDTLNKISNSNLGKKETVIRALTTRNLTEIRKISEFFFETSGIYNRLCKYLAYLYKYDWMVVPYVNEESTDEKKNNKILKDYANVLNYFDNSSIKYVFGNIALEVIKEGCYYGYMIDYGDKFIIQQLPAEYCRQRFTQGNIPIIEFNMKFFDDKFFDVEQRLKILKTFPKEFTKGYLMYKEGKLVPDFLGDTASWYMLTPGLALKFNLNGSDYPTLAGAIPAIIDLDEAQELDRKKTMQELLKILIQKVPLNKDFELVFDMEETQDIHNNALQMLSKAIGVNVLTTFTDVDIKDIADNNSTTTKDDLEKVERNLFNQAGISGMLFNTSGNIALEKSVLNDEASIYNLVLQFQIFLNSILDTYFNKNKKKYYFKAAILNTTIYNYMDVYSKYKELVQIGYPKELPIIALGQSQSSLLAMLHFENNMLHLSDKMVPPKSSNTMSSKDSTSDKKGRPEAENEDKSEKTIQNRESMGKE